MIAPRMEAIRLFRYCPRCAAAQPPAADLRDVGPFRCAGCGFTLYFSPAGAVATILIRPDGRALFIRRAHEPAAGKLGMPGGFVDPGEGAEDALRREVLEEIGLEIRDVQYVGSYANRYPYAGVTYHTVDLFFVARPVDPAGAEALDGVDDVLWLDPLTIPLDEIAFDSMRAALRRYRAGS
jgi:ADP-ribose pyrophosphatase YjhB (NUDIX family)